MVNPMGTKGNLAHAFADILHEMWQCDLPYITPYTFRVTSPHSILSPCAPRLTFHFYLAVHNCACITIRRVRSTRLARILEFPSGWFA
jgi:hypothetical protein